jgi:hypothetical protein
MDIQKMYWDTLVQIKHDQIYVDQYLNRSTKISNTMNLFTAFVSSSSIAGWAIWQQLSILWSIIIVLSQIINAIKDYLPFSKRVKNLTDIYIKLADLFNKMDFYWYDISNGKISKKDIHEKLYTFKAERDKIESRTIGNQYLPNNKRIRSRSYEMTEQYFHNY